MAISAAQEAKLDSITQRADCKFVVMAPEFEVTNLTLASGAFTFTDCTNIQPRYSWIDNGASITLDGSGSVQHGGAASTGHTWTLTDSTGGAAGGSKVDNGDETVYTAPASGSGVDRVQLATDGSAGETCYAYVAYGSDEQSIGAVTAFSASGDTGGWEMTVRAYSDCQDLDRQVPVLLWMQTYWNGAEDTFSTHTWPEGAFLGYVDRIRTVHEDSEHTYLELTLISPERLLNYMQMDETFFATSGTDEEVVIASLYALDPVWILLRSGLNERHNVYMYNDQTSLTNLKLSAGPIWDVAADVAARTFSVIYANRQGDIYCRPHPDIRWDDYEAAGATLDMEFTTSYFESIDVQYEDVDDPGADPPNPTDPTVGQVVLTGVAGNLDEIWARYPSNANWGEGPRVEKTGMICESAATLEAWAGRYWYSLQPKIQATLNVFLLHCLDIYDWVDLTFTPDTGRVTNTGVAISAELCWIDSINYTIDPGMGTWQGSIHIRSQADQSTSDSGENSDD